MRRCTAKNSARRIKGGAQIRTSMVGGNVQLVRTNTHSARTSNASSWAT